MQRHETIAGQHEGVDLIARHGPIDNRDGPAGGGIAQEREIRGPLVAVVDLDHQVSVGCIAERVCKRLDDREWILALEDAQHVEGGEKGKGLERDAKVGTVE